MDADRSLTALAQEQHGLVTVQQARAAGLTSDAIGHRIKAGRWRRVLRNVLQVEGSPNTEDSRLMASVLDAGRRAAVSYGSAGASWAIPGFSMLDIHVSRLRAQTARPARGYTIHEPRSLPDHHLTRLRGIPITNPTRTIFDLAGVVSPARLERALETAWSRRLLSGRTLHAMLPELAERGRTGISMMRQLLEERPPSYVPNDSGTELRAIKVLREAGISAFEQQVDLGDDHEWLGRVDLVDRKRRIVLEIDSERDHGALIDRRVDEARTTRLEAAGYVVRRVSDTAVWHRPAELVAAARKARSEAATL